MPINMASTQIQFKKLFARFGQENDLPLEKVIDEEILAERINRLYPANIRNRIFTPVRTLKLFVQQCFDPDKSCKQAVANLRAELIAEEEKPCSSQNGAYCSARQKMPEELVQETAEEAGENLHEQAQESWNWKGFSPKIIDGSTLKAADTDANQQEWPQPKSQKPGLGFPTLRIVAIFSYACGSLLQLAIGPYAGKQTGELSLFWSLFESLKKDDLLMGDRYYATYAVMALLQMFGIQGIFEQHASRKTDYKKAQLIGHKDYWVEWKKPNQKPDWMPVFFWNKLPESITVREMRCKGKTIVTTLLNPKQYTRKEIASFYTHRWDVEINLKYLKDTMKMEEMRCKTPEMVRKEIWAHMLAYNLIRSCIAQAAALVGLTPRSISFKACIQLLNTHAHILSMVDQARRFLILTDMFFELGKQRIGHRKKKTEPRAVKRRPKPYPRLQVPRRGAIKNSSSSNSHKQQDQKDQAA